MKVLSLWQPFGHLAVHGHKRYETRSFAPPRSLPKGDRFAIAATKQIKTEQQLLANNPRLQHHYQHLNFVPWDKLPLGCILGTVVLGDVIEITPEIIIGLDEAEYVYGDWRPGRFAWELLDPIVLAEPIAVRGQQGIWDYAGEIPTS